MVSTYGAAEIEEIYIGPNVTEIGVDAFMDMNLQAISVAKNNANYASVDGVLTNKAKDCLLFCPAGIEGAYTVPDGISVISDDAFSVYSKITDLELPDSVIVFGGLTTPGKSIKIGSGLMEWEGIYNAEYEAIEISKDNEYFTTDGLVVFNGDKTELLSYPFAMEEEIYSIPDGVVTVGDRALRSLNLRVLNIPASVESGLTGYRGTNNLTMLSALEEINVDSDNEAYQSIDGVLYTKDGKQLIAVPPNAESPVMIAEGVEEISSSAISNIRKTMEIHIPEGVTKLPFMLSYISVPYGEEITVDIYLPASLETINDSTFSGEVRALQRGDSSVLTLHCVKGSYADTYFREKGLNVVN